MTTSINQRIQYPVELGDERFCVYNVKILDCKNGYMDVRKYSTPISKIRSEYKDELKKEPSTLVKLFQDYLDQNPEYAKECQANLEERKAFKNLGRVSAEESKYKSIRFDSLGRTKQMLMEYAANNADKFKSFVTLTFEENQKDLDIANRKFMNYISQVRRKANEQSRELYYLGVPEFQKRGAVHYHLFISERCGSEIIPKRSKKTTYSKKSKKYRTIEYYDLPYWKYGYSTAEDLTDNKAFDENFNLALYMVKYLYKDFDQRLYGRTKILKSNNLTKPIYRYVLSDDLYETVVRYMKNTYSKVRYYKFEKKHTDDERVKEFESHSTILKEDDYKLISRICKVNAEYSENEKEEEKVNEKEKHNRR